MRREMKEIEQAGEMGVADILNVIKRYKRSFIAIPVVAGLMAFVLVQFVMHPKWEATVVVQIGQVGQPGQVGQTGKVIEPTTNVVSRMKQVSFVDATLKEYFTPSEAAELKKIFKSTLKASKVKDADLVELAVRGYSPEDAIRLAEASVNYLQKIHGEMMASSLARLNGQLREVTANVQTIKAESAYLKRKLDGSHSWDSYNATLSATILQSKANEMRGLVEKQLILEEQLSPAITFNTHSIESVSISEDPVSPNKLLIIAVAVLLGVFSAALFAFIHNAAVKKQPSL
jgi:capsular polysaccharide biosynthesis protein